MDHIVSPTLYMMTIRFKINTITDTETRNGQELVFQGSKNGVLYEKNEQTGFWEYESTKANKKSYLNLVTSDLPEWFNQKARQIFNQKKEALLFAPKFGGTSTR